MGTGSGDRDIQKSSPARFPEIGNWGNEGSESVN